MHNYLDQFSKDALGAGLAVFGKWSAEVGIAADAQRGDICFVPSRSSPDPTDAEHVGLLARIAIGPCLLELYQDPPNLSDVRSCLRKLLSWQHLREKEAPDEQARSPDVLLSATDQKIDTTDLATLWILSAGRPRSVLEGFRFAQAADWPGGVYMGALPAIPYRLVVLRELPEARSTLLLRLAARGTTRLRALRDLAALPPDAWERRHVGPLVVELLRELEQRGKGVSERLSQEEKEIQMTGFELYESIKDEGRREGRTEGHKEGRTEGHLRALAHMFERKLGRTLSEDERATLRTRIEALGADRVGDVVLDLAGPELASWLDDAHAR